MHQPIFTLSDGIGICHECLQLVLRMSQAGCNRDQVLGRNIPILRPEFWEKDWPVSMRIIRMMRMISHIAGVSSLLDQSECPIFGIGVNLFSH